MEAPGVGAPGVGEAAATADGALAAIEMPPNAAVAPAPPIAPAASSASTRREGFIFEVFMSAPASCVGTWRYLRA
ncbi:Uncharacterised protein [Achromobacter sp. 2789STDY5608621]|nr:Uncharacterised protein [Achromobacter sp. 2789STDY5608621]